jgi:hypothetical protein
MLRVRCIINSFGVYITPLGALISQVGSCTTSKSTKVAGITLPLSRYDFRLALAFA